MNLYGSLRPCPRVCGRFSVLVTLSESLPLLNLYNSKLDMALKPQVVTRTHKAARSTWDRRTKPIHIRFMSNRPTNPTRMLSTRSMASGSMSDRPISLNGVHKRQIQEKDSGQIHSNTVYGVQIYVKQSYKSHEGQVVRAHRNYSGYRHSYQSIWP